MTTTAPTARTMPEEAKLSKIPPPPPAHMLKRTKPVQNYFAPAVVKERIQNDNRRKDEIAEVTRLHKKAEAAARQARRDQRDLYDAGCPRPIQSNMEAATGVLAMKGEKQAARMKARQYRDEYVGKTSNNVHGSPRGSDAQDRAGADGR